MSFSFLMIPIPLSTTSLFLLKCLCLFLVKVDTVTKTNNTQFICACFSLFKGVSMVTDQPVSPENDHFNLKFYILTYVCQNFLNKIHVKLSLFAVLNGVSVF